MKVFATPDGNDLIIQPDPAEGEEEDAPQKEAVVDRRRALLVRAPTSLDPRLRIPGLAAGLNTNHNCLSAFIDRETLLSSDEPKNPSEDRLRETDLDRSDKLVVRQSLGYKGRGFRLRFSEVESV